MKLSELQAQAAGNSSEATVLALFDDVFYDVTGVAVPVADAIVLVLAPEGTSHPAAAAIESQPNTVAMLQGRPGDTNPTGGTSESGIGSDGGSTSAGPTSQT